MLKLQGNWALFCSEESAKPLKFEFWRANGGFAGFLGRSASLRTWTAGQGRFFQRPLRHDLLHPTDFFSLDLLCSFRAKRSSCSDALISNLLICKNPAPPVSWRRFDFYIEQEIDWLCSRSIYRGYRRNSVAAREVPMRPGFTTSGESGIAADGGPDSGTVTA